MDNINNIQENIENKNAAVFGLEDRVFPVLFMVLKLAGYWRPTIFKAPFNKFYDIFSYYCFFNVLLLLFTIILDNVVSDKSVHALIENLFLTITICNGVSKSFNVYFRRSEIIKILQNLMEIPWSFLRDDEEINIIEASQKSEKFITRFCIYLVIVNIVSYIFKPIIHANPDHNLVVDSYPLCTRSHPPCFWISYVHQVCGYISTSLMQVGYDGIIFNFIERISSLLKILEHRILLLPGLVEEKKIGQEEEVRYVKECIQNHHSICKAIKQFNDTFYITVSIQFISSITVVCTNIYLLSMQDLFSAEFNAVFIFLCCVLLQNFLFCWYGYKVSVNTLQLSDSIFNMNWCILQRESKKMLMYVMLKTSQRVYLFSSSIVKLSPESFINIVKVSYSAFNILQQTSKND